MKKKKQNSERMLLQLTNHVKKKEGNEKKRERERKESHLHTHLVI